MSNKIGNISFSDNGYKTFISKSKKEQLEKVYNSLSPKDYKEAEKLLKDVPNSDSTNSIETIKDGDIIIRDEQEATHDNGAGISGGDVKDNTPGRRKPAKRN